MLSSKATSLLVSLRVALVIVFAIGVAPNWAFAQGVRFKGVVTDEDGTPVDGALVKAEVIALNSSISGSGKSKKGGRYGLFVMQPARQYRITVTKEGYKEFVELFEPGGAWTNESLRIERDFVLEKGSGGGMVQIPEDVRGTYNKGITAFNARDWETARKRFERVLKVRPRLAAAHHVLAQTCVFQGDNEQALASATRAVELDPEDREFAEHLAKIHRGLGNDEQAEEIERKLGESTDGP